MNSPQTPPSAFPPCASAMAPPVSREQYLADMTTLREQIVKIRAAGNVEQAMQSGIPAQETAAKLTHQLIMSIASIEDKMATLEGTTAQALATIERTAAQTTPIEKKRKSLVESKCVGNIKTQSSDKAEFRMWNERFINQLHRFWEYHGGCTCAT